MGWTEMMPWSKLIWSPNAANRRLDQSPCRARLWLLCATLVLSGVSSTARPEPLIAGIDHLPVVVADLDRAEADFRALGFSIKPGRPHANGIRNAHVKFPDGTEIELITAPRAVDPLTTEYRAKLGRSEGPVYFGLYAPDRSALAAQIRTIDRSVLKSGDFLDFPASTALHPLFFGTRNMSPTDRPEHFAHLNTATRLSALWVRESPELRALFDRMGLPMRNAHQCGPIAGEVTAVILPQAQIYLVKAAESVVGADVDVRSLEVLEEVLQTNRVRMARIACDPNSVWVSPAVAHGIWLRFRRSHPS